VPKVQKVFVFPLSHSGLKIISIYFHQSTDEETEVQRGYLEGRRFISKEWAWKGAPENQHLSGKGLGYQSLAE